MYLVWVGKPGSKGVEGWPASDHFELDEALAEAKVESELYTPGESPEPDAKTGEAGDERPLWESPDDEGGNA